MRIRLTCPEAGDDYTDGESFIIDVDELTGDARIVKEGAALIDRDRSARLSIPLGGGIRRVNLVVEAA